MDDESIFIQKIEQVDNHSFSILWNDQTLQHFPLAEVQKSCPCAGCATQKPEKEFLGLTAVRMASVGRYAIKIYFSEGCSAGIYDYPLLRKIGRTVKG